VDFRNIQRPGPPFNFPTNLAISPNGDLYVADGYGNARIHRFSPDGTLLMSWGEPGSGPGQFHVPHGIAIDRHGTIYVADRENSRIQLFTAEGKFLTEWTDIARPCQVFIDDTSCVYVAELGYRAGMWPGTHPPTPAATGGRLSIFDIHGQLLARWGGGDNPCAPGDFFAPHDVWVDSRGDIYVSEVTMSAGGNRGLVDPRCHCIQKFIRLPKRDAS
jgi:DNA-binding beta-propeller fold protein YncE